MGPSQQKPVSSTNNQEFPKIAHQVFSNRQIVKNGTEDQNILVKVAVPHQRDYLTWVQKLTKLGYHESLLLPKRHSFNKQGFCGLSGVVDVRTDSFRYSTKTILFCFLTKSITENVLELNFLKKTNFGTLFLLCSVLLNFSMGRRGKQEIFVLIISLSARMGQSKQHVSTLGLLKGQITIKVSKEAQHISVTPF